MERETKKKGKTQIEKKINEGADREKEKQEDI
jgi:hypothetical protein